MTLAPWYFLTYFLTPAPTEPVLVPFETAADCHAHVDHQLVAWGHFLQRNPVFHGYGPNDPLPGGHWATWWADPLTGWSNSPDWSPGGSSFRMRAGALVVVGGCLRGSELTEKSLKALRTSP